MCNECKYLVSFVIPVFNAEKTISKCINSILKYAKGYSFEIILADDGSTDNSRAKCECYTSIHENIKYYYIENSGPANARNFGKKKAIGEYVTFIDADDYYIKGLKNALSFVSEAKYDVYRTKYLSESDNALSFENIIANKIKSYVWLLFVRKSVIDEIDFDKNYLIYEDLVFYYELMLLKPSMFYINVFTYYHTTSFNSITRSSDRLLMKLDSVMRLEKKIKSLNQNQINSIILKTVIDANLDRNNYDNIKKILQEKYYFNLLNWKYFAYKKRCVKNNIRCLVKKAYFKLRLK